MGYLQFIELMMMVKKMPEVMLMQCSSNFYMASMYCASVCGHVWIASNSSISEKGGTCRAIIVLPLACLLHMA